MIPRFHAAHLHRFMGSGRTSPALCGCEDENGNRAGDVIVKLRGALDNGVTGLLCELLASRLASYFGLLVPEPALVWIDAAFANLVVALESNGPHPERAERMRNSVGWNFGSRLLTDVTTLPIDKAIPPAMWQAATDTFAFDGLIQNPDRRFNNPNLFTRGNNIYLYDHELAFSFLHDLLQSATPWRLGGQRYLADHVFYRQLKGHSIDIESFTARLAALPGPALDGILAEMPPQWKNEDLEKIERHLRNLSAHAADFAQEVRRRLA
ncbi:MAG: hypothetical protein HY820_40560 [Acidobacteria bacterium]|nr:hypothetical protein [Acidobacteriota bacterium]